MECTGSTFSRNSTTDDICTTASGSPFHSLIAPEEETKFHTSDYCASSNQVSSLAAIRSSCDIILDGHVSDDYAVTKFEFDGAWQFSVDNRRANGEHNSFAEKYFIAAWRTPEIPNKFTRARILGAS